MSRIAYVNGRYLPHRDASVHIEDRGFQFADGVYEVCEVRHRYLLDVTRHLDRLERSLGELAIQMPVTRNCIPTIMREIVNRNRLTNGYVYMQANRGVYPRNHLFPPKSIKPSLIVTAKHTSLASAEKIAARGRWCHFCARKSLGKSGHQICEPVA